MGSARKILIVVPTGLAILLACGREPDATQISMGQPVSVGRYSLEVRRAQPAPTPPPPVNIFRTREDEKALVVDVYWRDLGDLDRIERLVFAESFLESRLAVVDHAGDRRRPVSAVQKDLLQMRDPGTDWRNWSVVFHVFEDSRSPRLIVENPDPQPGQPEAVSVDLGLWEDAP